METTAQTKPQKRILLTGVFGPFGVDDEFGRKENIMELFHNQVTKAQGIGSFRFHHRSFGLYFIASNIKAPTTVLDFPSRDRYIREIKKGYDVIGISFIAPNFVKAREMARLARIHAPQAEIILGGHGAAIEGIEDMIDCDHVVRGEGIRWMREYLGEDPEAPFVHPALPSTERQSIFGVPLLGTTASILVPGVGCVNGCSFCCTSHFFGRSYSGFISTGRQLFETARAIADERGTDAFFIMDENFLKDRQRAMDLVQEMERHNRFFTFHIFSSAEAITAFGIDNLVRLGVQFIWIGLESQTRQTSFEKNRDINPRELVQNLRAHGISVLASGILCMEHHTPDNIQEDIDFLVGLEADMVQFMLLTPLPTTALYLNHRSRGLLRDDVSLEDTHGQKCLNYKHPAFTDEQPGQVLASAFRKDFEVNSSSLYRIIETNFRGYLNLARRDDLDECLRFRKEQLASRVREYSLMLPVIARYAVNEVERRRCETLGKAVKRVLRGNAVVGLAGSMAATVCAAAWKLRVELKGDMIQPKTIVTHFPGADQSKRRSPIPLVELDARALEDVASPAAAAMVGIPLQEA